MESEFAVKLPCQLIITAKLIDQVEDKDHIVVKYKITSNEPTEWVEVNWDYKHRKGNNYIFHVTDVNIA